MRSWANSYRAVLILALTCAAACQRPRAAELSERFENVTEGAREDVLAIRLREIAVEFAAQVEETADEIIEVTDDPALRRNALLWKMHSIPASRLALLRIEPAMGLVDGWILCAQMREYFETGAGREIFGEHQERVVAAARRLEDRVVEVATSIARDQSAVTLWQERVREWVSEQPLDDLHFETHSPWIKDYAQVMGDDVNVLDSIVSLEELAFDVAQRLNIYMSDMPRQARWQVEYAVGELMASERFHRWEESVSRLESLERIDDVSGALGSVCARLDELTAVVAAVPQIVANERVQAITALQAEIDTALQVLHEERQAVQSAIADERSAALEDIDRQRSETMEMLIGVVAEERSLLIAELDRLTSSSLEAAEHDLKRVVDHAFIRLVELLAAIAVVGGIVAIVRGRLVAAHGAR